MKKILLSVLSLFLLFCSGCKKDIKYSATIRIPVNRELAPTYNSRFAFSFEDVQRFDVRLSGSSLYGESIDQKCTSKDFYYKNDTSEIVVNVKEVGYYQVTVRAYNAKSNFEIASGTSERFFIDEGEEKEIVVPIKYKETVTFNYRLFYNFSNIDIKDIDIALIVTEYFDDGNQGVYFKKVFDYVEQLKTINPQWWTIWGTEEIPTDLDFTYCKVAHTSDVYLTDGDILQYKVDCDYDCWYTAVGGISFINGTTVDGKEFSKQTTLTHMEGLQESQDPETYKYLGYEGYTYSLDYNPSASGGLVIQW